jgi:hypothetical protein
MDVLTLIGGLCCVDFKNPTSVFVGIRSAATVNYRPVLSSDREPTVTTPQLSKEMLRNKN